MNDTSSVDIFRLSIDNHKPSITFETSWVVLLILLLIIILSLIFKRKIKGLLFGYHVHEMEIEISGTPKVSYKVERNNENLYIANRIYIELTTRKAAIIIDENTDSIEEIYNSWYKLFGIIRDEIKSLPGKYLRNHDSTNALMGLSRKILNEALRPHLTQYQAAYRNWLSSAKKIEENLGLTPQELQKKYPHYIELISSMKEVNNTLINYANELDKLIKGK